MNILYIFYYDIDHNKNRIMNTCLKVFLFVIVNICIYITIISCGSYMIKYFWTYSEKVECNVLCSIADDNCDYPNIELVNYNCYAVKYAQDIYLSLIHI